MQRNGRENDTQGVAVFARSFPPWTIGVVVTCFVLIAYFLSARLGLALLTQPDGVAVFWPAAGVSAGLLIGLGRQARLPVMIGVAAATIAANLLGDRNILSSVVFAACNAIEAVLIAGLVERYFGPGFRLDNLQRVLGLVAAAIIGCGVSGIGGTVGYLLFHTSTASALTIWYHWFASDAIGVVTVAPFVIGFVAMTRDPPSLGEAVEGAAALTTLALLGQLLVVVPYSPWDDIALVSIFPVLLWITARGRSYFTAVAAFIVALTIVWMTTFEIGLLGNQNVPTNDRILTAQAVILTFSLCALVLAALFSERRESEVQLQDALKAGGASAFDWDVRSGRSLRSENAAQILGLDPKRDATAAAFFERVHLDDRLRVKTCLLALRPDNPSCATSFRYLRPDGRQIWLEATAKALFDEAGLTVRIQGLAEDITERRQIEDQLVEARKAADQANLAKSAFLAAASHDLRQPLQTLKILQGTLAQQIHDSSARKPIVSIGRSLETMTDMLTSLLDINQLEAGYLRPSPSNFPINDIFDTLAADFLHLATEKGLQWRLVRSRIVVRSDRRLLKEMIRNLLSNAIRYTDHGSILVGCRRAGDKVRIEVWDSGVGIMSEQMPRIFEEHYQGPQSAQSGGFGLGLAIVQRLANILAHHIAVRSTPGKGSIFSIEVPLNREQAEARVQTELPLERLNALVSGTILIIEDEGSVRHAVVAWLKSEGLDPVSVANGNEALALITEKRIRPDLVLSDYNLPGPLNGIQSVQALRAEFSWKIPAIILTGDTRSQVIDEIAKHDVAIAIKPMKLDQLKRLVVSLLAVSKADRPVDKICV